MSSGSRAVAAWLTVTGLGLVAAFVLMSQRYSAPTPRWDLIGCFAVAALGVTGCLVTVRGRTFADFVGVGPRPWWPDLRALWKGLFPLAWSMVLIYFVSAMIHVSPAALQMVEEGHVIAPVEVSEVLSTQREGRDRGSRYYSVEVRASVPYSGRDETRTVEFDSEYPVKPGDKVWALYAPSAPQLGVFLEDDRAELEEKAGGPESGVPYLVLVIFLALLVGALAYSAPGLPGHMRRALRQGRARRLSVQVAGGTATLAESPSATDYNRSGPNDKPALKPTPCVLLSGPAGEHIETAVSKSIDPIEVARALESRQGHFPAALYWTASGKGEGKGVLLSGDYYLRCQKVAAEGGESVPAGGDSVTDVSEARRKPREIRRFPEWSTELHTDGFGWSLFILLLLGVIALGVGLIASIILGVIAFLALFFVLYGASVDRSEALEKLLPDFRRENSGRNSEDSPRPPAREEP